MTARRLCVRGARRDGAHRSRACALMDVDQPIYQGPVRRCLPTTVSISFEINYQIPSKSERSHVSKVIIKDSGTVVVTAPMERGLKDGSR